MPAYLLPAAIAFALGLLFDLLQYATGALLWTRQNFRAERWSETRNTPRAKPETPERAKVVPARAVEELINEEDDFPMPVKINHLPRVFFTTKLLAVAVAYVLLVVALATQYFWRQSAGIMRVPGVQADTARMAAPTSPGVSSGQGTISGPPGAARDSAQQKSVDTSRRLPRN